MNIGIREAYRRVVPVAVRQSVFSLRQRLRPWSFFKHQAVHLMDKNVRDMAQRLRRLQGKYRGDRCFIMGSGPSLNEMDLELFSQEYVWGVNKCYLLFDRISWRPTFYTAVDTRVVPDIAPEINQLIVDMPQMSFFFPVRFREQWLLRSNTNVYWYRKVPLDETNLPFGMFTRDASRWVSGVRTVIIAALQLAVYLGFDPIYLIGCDTSYSVPASVRFEGGDRDKLISVANDDPNHFDPRYFGKGSEWHAPHVDRMIFHYEQATQACVSLGVSVYNATVGGKLEVFPRVNYVELFENN